MCVVAADGFKVVRLPFAWQGVLQFLQCLVVLWPATLRIPGLLGILLRANVQLGSFHVSCFYIVRCHQARCVAYLKERILFQAV
jgi:hypothetical protein